jgi:Zn-dependent M28 family amino/carboxypeptidase
MKKILRLIMVGMVLFLILKASTFGWKIFAPHGAAVKIQDLSIPAHLKSHVQQLSETIGDRNLYEYAKLQQAAEYIVEQFKACGYQVEFQEYAAAGRKFKNIIAVKKGARTPGEIIVVGAHYDSCDNPGADDNASGVAGLLELARIFSRKDIGRTIEFVAFVNEEPPFFKTGAMGSMVYARSASSRQKDIKGALVLEMIGYYSNAVNSQRYPMILGFFYPNRGNFITVVGDLKSRSLNKEISRVFKKQSAFPIESLSLGFVPGADFSDHWSFWQAGYPAVMITDTAFLRNHNYHHDSDTLEKLNFDHMADVIEGLVPAIEAITGGS